MKRDWKIIEKILTELESDIAINEIINNDEIIRETYHLLTDEGCILSDYDSEFPVARLTMKGYDMLEHLRAFKSRKKLFEDSNIPITIDIIKSYFQKSAEEIENIFEMCAGLNRHQRNNFKDLVKDG